MLLAWSAAWLRQPALVRRGPNQPQDGSDFANYRVDRFSQLVHRRLPFWSKANIGRGRGCCCAAAR